MIKAIITDFDGTLVDTFYANLKAYQKAFAEVGLSLPENKYRECFGFRFERFMSEVGVTDAKTAEIIKEAKKEFYPEYFEYIRPNTSLINLILGFKSLGGKTAVASTARRENLMNVIEYLGISGHFDLIFAGADVKQGKPSPEIYVKAMASLGIKANETLIFEDSKVGIEAAIASGANYMIIPELQFDHENRSKRA